MNPNFIPLDTISNQPFDLDSIQIATPCRADWNAMSGDHRVRHCKSCAKNVYNLSALSRAAALRLIQEKEGDLCVQLHRRADGTLITSDCAVGISTWKKPRRALQNLFAATIAAILGIFGVANGRAADQNSALLMGAPRMMGEAVRGEIAPTMGQPQIIAPKTAVKSAKTNAKRTSKSARKPKRALQHRPLQHRRHR